MKYAGKAVEVLSRRRLFGRQVAQIKILSTGEVKDVPEIELEESDGVPSTSEISFRAIAARIRAEIANQAMLAPLESTVLPLPHQILALEKVMSAPAIRFLMADEVGMGKTIETGLVLKELKIRGLVRRSLIVVPKSAMLQWKTEMKKHFNENFHIYDTAYISTLERTFSMLEGDNEINIWAQHNNLIVSMDALKPIETRQGWSKERVQAYNHHRIQSVLNADFDMLVIDECHKVGGGSAQVGRYQMADLLCNAIPHVLLLSATPHRGKSDHFRRLLRLLDADAFSGEGMPSLSELNPYVVRTEKRQAVDYNGKPLFNKRRTETIEVSYDSAKHRKQKALYTAIGNYVTTGFNLAQQTNNTSYGFVMILFQRLMSSSTKAILDAMERRVERLSSDKEDVTKESIATTLEAFGFEGQLEFDFEQKVLDTVAETHARYETELELLKGLVRDARDCIATETDAKVEFLLEKIQALKLQTGNPDLKILLFTEFTSTQMMLKRILEQLGGYRCVAINGSMEFEERIAALKSFKEEAQILISTDAAGESLNMQFAYIVINYDMPWNPMVVEQRIGRVDRIGQTHEVLALNLLLDNSVDKRVYEIITTKLEQILAELGIDKTADVLDSTIEQDGVNKLYLTSLLDPAALEAQGATWLGEIREKLRNYQSTEGALPTLRSEDIHEGQTDGIKYSPLPKWLEFMSCYYLQSKNLSVSLQTDGTLLARFPGLNEQVYTFNVRESINNPIPVALSLQHSIIQSVLSEAVPFAPGTLVPVAHITAKAGAAGVWSLWSLEVKNAFETQTDFVPLFFSDTGDLYPAYAQNLWELISTNPSSLQIEAVLDVDQSRARYEQMLAVAEEALGERYRQLEEKVFTVTDKVAANKEKAFAFTQQQLQRIGIENIRNTRMKRLEAERSAWQSNFDSERQVVPALHCLMILALKA